MAFFKVYVEILEPTNVSCHPGEILKSCEGGVPFLILYQIFIPDSRIESKEVHDFQCKSPVFNLVVVITLPKTNSQRP